MSRRTSGGRWRREGAEGEGSSACGGWSFDDGCLA